MEKIYVVTWSPDNSNVKSKLYHKRKWAEHFGSKLLENNTTYDGVRITTFDRKTGEVIEEEHFK